MASTLITVVYTQIITAGNPAFVAVPAWSAPADL